MRKTKTERGGETLVSRNQRGEEDSAKETGGGAMATPAAQGRD
jgi:hypothetical protein